jgi:hypothetical protein
VSDRYPLLDMQGDVDAADDTLQDLAWRILTVLDDTEGHFPPGAAEALANIAALRTLLAEVLPAALKHAIAAERTIMDEDAAHWEPSSY